ncbi:hypothetical protein AB1A65_07720 [Muricauda sp. ANG21]|uniref:hypothetical protein n=1 Tax=Allomuricauda sp. ANG21 TaxID=3042468 RepID=UPI003456CE0E
MTSKKVHTFILIALFCGLVNAQNSDATKRRNRGMTSKTADQIDQVDQTVQNTNNDIDQTVEGIDNTIEGTKETVEKVGRILFGSKKEKSKNKILIFIDSVAYGDENVQTLYNELSKKNGTKKTSKTFSDGVVTIQIESKQNADAIWQEVPQNVRASFKVNAMGENNISVELPTLTE